VLTAIVNWNYNLSHMQKATFPICMLLLCASSLAQTRRPAPPQVPACENWSPDSTTDAAVVNFTFRHVTKLSPADKRKLAQEIRKKIHPCGNLKDDVDEIAERVRQAYQERGYFKALVEEPKISVVRQNEKQELIDITISVEEDRQYRLQDISFTGVTAFAADDLRAQFPVNAGDIFNTDKIRMGLENLRKLYSAGGYINFTPVPDTRIDETAGLISLVIDVDEGGLFHYGKLIIKGEESQPGAREKLLKVWQAYQGTPYDGEALEDFLRDIHARPNVKPEEVFETTVDYRSKLVNVKLTLLNPPKEMKALLNRPRVGRTRSSANNH